MSNECVGCDDCVNACRRRHGVARLRRPHHALAITFPEVCQHCELPLCAEGCIAGGMYKNPMTGAVEHYQERCVGCWSCILACPYAAVTRDERGRPVSAKCGRCAGYRRPACEAACPSGALRVGTDEELAAALARPHGVIAVVARVALCVALPAAGLVGGFAAAEVLKHASHAVGIAAGVAVTLSLVLPLLGRLCSPLVRRAGWTRLHLLTGVVATTAALVHTTGKFGFNAQSLAALSLCGLAVTGTAYRYLRPVWLVLLSQFASQVSPAPDEPNGPVHPRVAASALRSQSAAAWVRWMRRVDGLLAGCRVLHIVWAIITVSLVLAHVVIMTWVGATGS